MAAGDRHVTGEKKVFEGIRRVLCLADRHRPWSEDPAAASSSTQRNKKRKHNRPIRISLFYKSSGNGRFPLRHISQGAHQRKEGFFHLAKRTRFT
ncbi:hypothetical protein TNIN_144341 [Trichonephila inaurata madagascariensis]|uniref:Uncharacterized protein n=1 Tax=Trichonephila inaurata madagascariensis TaxID=2747483 RepID=A0A8X6MC47_9ARAC|nr:hypothetical protein TNIN_144341 [Trichonephila inaurata madagascariensis]